MQVSRFIVAVILEFFSVNFALAQNCHGETWTPDNRYVINGDEALDTKTGLIWRRCLEGMRWNGSACIGLAKSYGVGLTEIQAHISSQGGGWRMPSLEELKTLRSGESNGSEGKGCGNPAINTKVFWIRDVTGPHYETDVAPNRYAPDECGGHVEFLYGNFYETQTGSTCRRIRLVRNKR